MKLEALDHPKTLDLAARLGIELPTAIGHLELLWAFTGKKAPQGDIGKWPDGAIARACHWMGRPEEFLLALRESGFIEADCTHRLTIHDWPDHAPRWVKAKLKTLGADFIRPSTAPIAPTTVGNTGPPIEPTSKGSEEKTSQAKPEDARRRACATPGLDVQAFERWIEYRREIRKPLKPSSIEAAAVELTKFGPDQAAVVQQSIANGWNGLFDLKRANGGHRAQPGRRLKSADELEAEAIARGEDPYAFG